MLFPSRVIRKLSGPTKAERASLMETGKNGMVPFIYLSWRGVVSGISLKASVDCRLVLSAGPSELDLSMLADSTSLADVPSRFDEQVCRVLFTSFPGTGIAGVHFFFLLLFLVSC